MNVIPKNQAHVSELTDLVLVHRDRARAFVQRVALGALAVIWLFRNAGPVARASFPPALRVPTLLALLALLFDFITPVLTTLEFERRLAIASGGRWSKVETWFWGKAVTEKEITPGYHVVANRLTICLFWLSVAATLVAYSLLLIYFLKYVMFGNTAVAEGPC